MNTRELIAALRQGDEEDVRFEINFLLYDPYWPRELRAISREEALRLVIRGGAWTRFTLSEHPDGRVREAALQAMQPSEGLTLYALLKRAKDWVPMIAKLAGERAIPALRTASDEELAKALPLIFALTRLRRSNHDALEWAYREEVGRRSGLARRLRRANRNGPLGSWAAYNLIGKDDTAQSLAKERLEKGSPKVQLDTARGLLSDPGSLPGLLASPNSAVRRLALDAASPEARRNALVDPNAGVRNDARYLLGQDDYAALYRLLLPLPGAISGLGETGDPADAEILRPLMRHPRSEVRARALESLTRLVGSQAEPEILAAFRDPSRRVQRTAVESLRRAQLSLDPETVLDLDLSPGPRLRLLDRGSRWRSLAAALSRSPRPSGVEEWLDMLARRPQIGGLPPSANELERIEASLTASQATLDPSTFEALNTQVRYWHSRT